MHSSAPSDFTYAHFSGPPALAMTRAPAAFPICTTAEPTAPAAPFTKSVSPARIFPCWCNPMYAVVGHSTHATASSSEELSGTFVQPETCGLAFRCDDQTPKPVARSPTFQSGCLLARTVPPKMVLMGAPIATAGMYCTMSVTHTFCVGSQLSTSTRTMTSPSAASFNSLSFISNISSANSPVASGRRARWRVFASMVWVEMCINGVLWLRR
mmetsp:Transcript_21168/g.50073  ORF Transcript_21168/g.50073 Transcript_21168/m.50073 type:complete len:212 (-) Transcript_21168:50-685(-)